MNRQIHGILSLLIMTAAAIIAILAIVQSSVFWAIVYIVGLLLSGFIIIFSFCTKCPCRDTECGHVIPGKLIKFFPRRDLGPYSVQDKLGVVVPLVFLVMFPQYWLLANTTYFVIFAVFCLIAAADIQLFVCKGCTNSCCPFHQK